MSRKRTTHVFPALAAASGVLLLGCSLCLAAGGGTTSGDYAARLGSEEQEATAPEKTRRPARRMRASLSLPYFSFAQSLNPRS